MILLQFCDLTERQSIWGAAAAAAVIYLGGKDMNF